MVTTAKDLETLEILVQMDGDISDVVVPGEGRNKSDAEILARELL